MLWSGAAPHHGNRSSTWCDSPLNVRNRVVSGQSAFGAKTAKADIRSLRKSRFLLGSTFELLVTPRDLLPHGHPAKVAFSQ